MSRILIGSPIRQKNTILKEFLNGLLRVEKGNNIICYYFVDDNIDEISSKMLKRFYEENNKTVIKNASEFNIDNRQDYLCDEYTHYWSNKNIERISVFKNSIIDYCIKNKYDYLFLIDSDIVVDKRSLLHLISRNVDIVSNVFYTQWTPNDSIYPQCFWIPNLYSKFESFTQSPSNEVVSQMETDFYAKIRVPGLYKVDGLGACTLIKTVALKKGVNFSSIPNLSVYGEDRDFCIRAGALGFDLYIDTVYPAYHIFREEYLSRVNEFIENGFSFDMCQTYLDEENSNTSKSNSQDFFLLAPIRLLNSFRKYIRKRKQNKVIIEKKEREKEIYSNRDLSNKRIVLQMIIHNECGRYLEQCLSSVKALIDYYVIIDNASNDKTIELCEKLLKGLPHTIVRNKTAIISDDVKLRKQLWNEVLKNNPGWIMSLDADEVLEEDGAFLIRELIKNNDLDGYSFKYYDMWNAEEYREDEYWHSHFGYRPYIMRYIKGYNYVFQSNNQHCDNLPLNYYDFKHANVNLKIKHFGWADSLSRKQKYERYMKLDPDGKFGNIKHYESILDVNPNLKKFSELPKGL